MEIGKGQKIILRRPGTGSSGGGGGTWNREKPAIQTSTGIFFVDISQEITNGSEVVLMNGLELDRGVDYTISGTRIIFDADVEMTLDDKVIIKYES